MQKYCANIKYLLVILHDCFSHDFGLINGYVVAIRAVRPYEKINNHRPINRLRLRNGSRTKGACVNTDAEAMMIQLLQPKCRGAPENSLPLRGAGHPDLQLSVKAAGPPQRRVQRVRTIRGGQHHHPVAVCSCTGPPGVSRGDAA